MEEGKREERRKRVRRIPASTGLQGHRKKTNQSSRKDDSITTNAHSIKILQQPKSVLFTLTITKQTISLTDYKLDIPWNGGGQKLQNDRFPVYLGITLDNTLSFNEHYKK